jgi:Tfp pilus assembly protein PilX
MKKILFNKKGVVLILTFIIMTTLAATTVAFLYLTSTQNRSTGYDVANAKAFWLAEAGLQRGLWELSKGGGTWTGWTGTNPKVFQGTLTNCGDYDVSVANPASNSPQITATGYMPSRSASSPQMRVVYASASKGNWFTQYSAFSTGIVTLGGSGYTDSYDSSKGVYNKTGSDGKLNKGSNGDVSTNSDLNISGGSHIYGNVDTGPSGIFNNQSFLSGTISHDMNHTVDAVVVPTSLSALPDSGTINLAGIATQTLPSGNYKYQSIATSRSGALTIIGPANIYLTGSTSLSTAGNSTISISASSTGPVVIYANGDITAGGGGVVNNTNLPVNLQVYGSKSSGTQDLSISGAANFYGVVYAPNGNVTVANSGGLFGSVVGKTINVSGSAGIHRDVSLNSYNAPSFIPSKCKLNKDWDEVR